MSELKDIARKTPDPQRCRGSLYLSDPIVSLSSGSAQAAVAVLRFSGEGSHELAAKLLRTRLDQVRPRHMFLAALYRHSGDVLDEPLVVFFQGPASFTGEDSGEIHLHGSPFIIQETLSLFYASGFRAARPGEFTERAFLNGKMELSTAEGINELIRAQSQQQWLAARQLASGNLATAIEGLRQEIIAALAYLEARIDFPDEDEAQSVGLCEVRRRVEAVKTRIDQLRMSYQSGQIAREGLGVAIVGAPNAGKSTLMNHLLGKNRAIVTPVAGTTRDYIEESCLISGRLIRLIDTAGLRQSADDIEMIGVSSALELAKKADLVVLLTAASEVLPESLIEQDYLHEIDPEKLLRVISKSDLLAKGAKRDARFCYISCKSGDGIEDFHQLLANRVDESLAPLAQEGVFVSSARHLSALNKASGSLDDFFSALAEQSYDECLGFELQEALRALSTIIGKVHSEDILDEIFRSFCIGK